MMKEEEILSSRLGRRNPFRVPEGYFESLSGQVMAQLPEKRQSRLARSWYYAAASVAVLLVAGAVSYFSSADNSREVEGMTVATAGYEASYFDEAADYAMLDNQDIYACLTNE